MRPPGRKASSAFARFLDLRFGLRIYLTLVGSRSPFRFSLLREILMKRRLRFSAPLALLAAFSAAGCSRIQSRAAFKDGNKEYREENFKKAIEEYKQAVDKDPRFAEAWFYLGSANQAMYRPGKDTPENKAYLERAIEAYRKSLEVNDLKNDNLKEVRTNTLGALTGIYSDDPFKSFDTAQGYAQQLLQDNPDDPKNLYAIANLYEKFGKIDLALLLLAITAMSTARYW
jgi:tetratricopeptide (TPR) repeat protein